MSTDSSNSFTKKQNILTNQSKLCELFNKSVPCVLGRIIISMMHFLDFICVKMHDFCVNAIPVADCTQSGADQFVGFMCSREGLAWGIAQVMDTNPVGASLIFQGSIDGFQSLNETAMLVHKTTANYSSCFAL